MHLAYTDEQEELRRELRAYYEKLLDPETQAALAADLTGPTMRAVVRQMAADGWLGIGWPTEYGGQGRGPMEQFIFFDESMRAGAPVPMLTINTVGPTIMQFGTDEQKDFFLPRILRGEIHFCIGYSEPGAGTDLASVRTSALRDGDEYVINGQKMWTSYASSADYCWLAVRTDPEAKKHKGMSMIIVPMDTPGIEVQPLQLMGEHEIGAVHYDDVRVPAANLVGGENNGWSLITNQLNHERVTLCSPGMVDRALIEVRQWAQDTLLPDGRRVIDQDWVQHNLARAYAGFEFLRLINWKVAWQAENKELSVADASATKVFGTELYLDAIGWLFEILGEPGYLKTGSPGALLRSRLEHLYRGLVILTFGGGTNEIQRDLISVFGLGMPMAKR
ncbi:MAG TPA: acyl-CoA dehydrogenase family protein [Acidimicrobiales bacterium]|nr:acyl-CoA dehydrogenase family protein [Acidimicrobiales bacterium]